MIGDWVYAIDDNGEKHPCRANNLEYEYINKRGDFCVDFYGTGYEAEWPDVTFNVEPIPITPEILEKNGFVECVFCEGEYELHCDGYRIIVHQSSGYTRIYKGGYLPILNNQNFKFIHQIQHALRLCGIEKEIVI